MRLYVGSNPTSDPYASFGGQFGGYTDQEAGLVLFAHRYYDPANGRWLTRDPIGYVSVTVCVINTVGAYNTVSTAAVCPSCKKISEVIVQFKYGHTWQIAYEMCDTLQWGGNDIGVRDARKIVVDGIAEKPCPACGFDDEWNFYVVIENNRITQVIANADPSIFHYDNFVVLE